MQIRETLNLWVPVLGCLISLFSSTPVEAACSESSSSIVVYINWDGFAHAYIDLAEQQNKIPTLTRIKNEEGVYFSNAYTGIPSITNAMQAAIASGVPTLLTDNHYRYFNKKLNTVIQEQPGRKNEAETLAEAAVRQNLPVVSINQFTFQNRGTISGDPDKAYIIAPPGANGYSDATARFDEAIRLVKTLKSGNIAFKQIPRLIALYMDDLDGIGHNESPTYGISLAVTETMRQQAIVDRLALMDAKLGELIQACKDVGIYHRMCFVLTTDHGMAPFGSPQTEPDDSAISKITDLMETIEGLGNGFKCEILHPSQTVTPSEGTDIALVTVGLQVQLSYVNVFDSVTIHTKNKMIANALKNKEYIDCIMFPEEIVKHGAKSGFADLIISPRPPYHFQLPGSPLALVRGQHDSLAESAQHIAAFMWGNGIQKGFTDKKTVYAWDFTPTMAQLLGINAPLDSTGIVLNEALKHHPHPPKNIPVKREDTEALANAATIRYWDKDASGKTVTSLLSPMASLEVTHIPASRDLIIRYNTEIDGKLSLYVNNQYIRDIFFPATGYSPSRYAARTLNLSLDQNDTLKLVNDPTHNCTGINIDCFIFLSKSPNERGYLPLEPPTPAAPEPEKPEPSLATQTPDDSF